ncbi:MAG: DUF502 domain-containing protein [Candidatus Omnitrophica bacterium]|nr:DUF502 domain-containing protein [Candidatus Omnitrophota bacterium]MCM8801701.1 DUF502 domain-containing protein [Candidatus Omnitrophota bacterium]
MKTLKKHFISGIIFIIPVSLSIWILFKVFIFLENILGNFFKKFFPNIYTPGIGLISLILLILFVGFLANNFLGKKILKLIESLFENTPFLNKIFSFLKSIIQQITEDKKQVFKGVVRIKLPNDSYTIGFITREEMESKNIYVFVPTVPNISTGFIIVIPQEKVERLDISTENALKLIISMGIFK